MATFWEITEDVSNVFVPLLFIQILSLAFPFR